MYRYILAFLLGLVSVAPLFSQKVEREKKVSASELPAEALSFLEKEHPDRGRTKYYLESGSGGENFEAKFKWKGECYSVEFFQDGKWKDTEKEVYYDDLSNDLRQKTATVLQSDFLKAKVKRVQEQTMPGRSSLRYEMEVKGKSENGWAMWEYLFEADGALVKKQKIILPSNNITLY